MHYLLDTSAVAKRYIPEANSKRVHDLLGDATTEAHISALARTELASAFSRRVREGRWSFADARVKFELFIAHEQLDYRAAGLTAPVQRRAEELLWRHVLRAADAIHIATGLLLAGAGIQLTFVTADRRQADAATAEGLTVEYVGSGA